MFPGPLRSIPENPPYLQRHVLPEGDVSGHRQVVQLQDVGDALQTGQVLLDLSDTDPVNRTDGYRERLRLLFKTHS